MSNGLSKTQCLRLAERATEKAESATSDAERTRYTEMSARWRKIAAELSEEQQYVASGG